MWKGCQKKELRKKKEFKITSQKEKRSLKNQERDSWKMLQMILR